MQLAAMFASTSDFISECCLPKCAIKATLLFDSEKLNNSVCNEMRHYV